jgi:hypothetical protein
MLLRFTQYFLPALRHTLASPLERMGDPQAQAGQTHRLDALAGVAAAPARPVGAALASPDQDELRKQRKMKEAWRRNHRWLTGYWLNLEAQPSRFGLQEDDLRFDSIDRSTQYVLKAYGVDQFDPAVSLTNKGRAQDVLGLIKPPSIEQVRIIRFLGSPTKNFNTTSARIFIEQNFRERPQHKEQWLQRAVDDEQLAESEFFGLTLDPALNFTLGQAMIERARQRATKWEIERWAAVIDFLHKVERGDYTDYAVPAFNTFYSYTLLMGLIKSETAPSAEQMLARLRAVSLHDKMAYSSDQQGQDPHSSLALLFPLPSSNAAPAGA